MSIKQLLILTILDGLLFINSIRIVQESNRCFSDFALLPLCIQPEFIMINVGILWTDANDVRELMIS